MTKSLLIPLALLLGSLAVGILYLKPTWGEFQRIRQETKYLARLSAEFDELIQNRDALIAKINAVPRKDLERIEQIIPKDAKTLDYLVSLEHAVRQRGLLLNRISAVVPTTPRGVSAEGAAPAGVPGVPRPTEVAPTAKKAPALFRELSVDLGVIGTYEILKIFLQDLERYLRLTDVINLSFSAPGKASPGDSGGSAGTGIFQFSIKLKTYYQ